MSIIKTDETKSLISFAEGMSGMRICMMKEKFNLAYQRFIIWRENNFGTDFMSELFRLLCHADDFNKLKILQGFPEETVVYLLWYTSKDEKKFFETWGNIKIEEPERKETEE